MESGLGPPEPGVSSPRAGAPSVGRRWAFVPLLLWLASGCASDLARVEGGYRHTRHHYTIGVPRGHGPPWKRIEIEGAWIAFRRPGPQTLSMQSRCGRPVAHAAVMARGLVVGVRDRRLRQAGPIVVAGRNGWSQTFDTRSAGIAVRVKTVTVVIERCTYDWMLAVVGEFAAAERAFDAWWGSFRLDSKVGSGEKRS